MSTSPNFHDSAASIANLYSTEPLIRAVNFHNTSRAKAAQYDRELAHYSQFFSSVIEDELDEYTTTGRWRKSKPGLIVAVYEGYRNGYDVLAPLLERYGLIGWFFTITGFVDAPVEEQVPYAQGHRIGMLTREYPNKRYALTWDELRQLDRKHVVASHARSHSRLASLDPETIKQEVVGSQDEFQKQLGHRVRSFGSLTGPPYGEYPVSDKLVLAAGYDFVFSNYRIQRVQAKA